MARRLFSACKEADAASLEATQTIKTAGCTVILLYEDLPFPSVQVLRTSLCAGPEHELVHKYNTKFAEQQVVPFVASTWCI